MAEDSMEEHAQQAQSERPIYSGGGALTPREPRSWKPFVLAAIVVSALAVAVFFGVRHANRTIGGASLSQPSAYAAQMPVSNIQMSETSNMAGGKLTYIDAHVANNGHLTVHAASVQIVFRDFNHGIALRQVLPLVLIRSRQPYVDTEMVSADPIAPGQNRELRLTFEFVPDTWNGNYPEVHILGVDAR